MVKTREERRRDAQYIRNGILGSLAFCLGVPALVGLLEALADAL